MTEHTLLRHLWHGATLLVWQEWTGSDWELEGCLEFARCCEKVHNPGLLSHMLAEGLVKGRIPERSASNIIPKAQWSLTDLGLATLKLPSRAEMRSVRRMA